MTISQEVLSKFKNKSNIFMETGTWFGKTTEMAYSIGFKEVFTIELSEKHYHGAMKKFSAMPNIHCMFGDSVQVLPKILQNIKEVVVFWLDGHFSMGDTAKGPMDVPLLQELDAIAKHPIKNHILLIDDIRLIGNESEPVEGWRTFSIQDVKEKILSVNPNYVFHFEDGHVENDILVAQVL